MSLETSIAALTAQAGLLLDLPQQLATTATAQIAAVGAAFQAAQTGLGTSFYVDQITGIDTNAGTSAAPLKSIDKALALTPRLGICNVSLKADYAVAGANINIGSRQLVIYSDPLGPFRSITHQVYTGVIGGVSYNRVYGFVAGYRGALLLATVNWVMPNDGSTLYTRLPGDALFGPDALSTLQVLSLRAMTLTRPAASTKWPVFDYPGPKVLEVTGVTFAGLTMTGHWLASQPSEAGVVAATLPDLLTNLTPI